MTTITVSRTQINEICGSIDVKGNKMGSIITIVTNATSIGLQPGSVIAGNTIQDFYNKYVINTSTVIGIPSVALPRLKSVASPGVEIGYEAVIIPTVNLFNINLTDFAGVTLATLDGTSNVHVTAKLTTWEVDFKPKLSTTSAIFQMLNANQPTFSRNISPLNVNIDGNLQFLSASGSTNNTIVKTSATTQSWGLLPTAGITPGANGDILTTTAGAVVWAPQTTGLLIPTFRAKITTPVSLLSAGTLVRFDNTVISSSAVTPNGAGSIFTLNFTGVYFVCCNISTSGASLLGSANQSIVLRRTGPVDEITLVLLSTILSGASYVGIADTISATAGNTISFVTTNNIALATMNTTVSGSSLSIIKLR